MCSRFIPEGWLQHHPKRRTLYFSFYFYFAVRNKDTLETELKFYQMSKNEVIFTL